MHLGRRLADKEGGSGTVFSAAEAAVTGTTDTGDFITDLIVSLLA